MRLPPDDSRRVAAREAALDVEVHAKALIDALERAERALVKSTEPTIRGT
jgi:hypothetical protein